jgi:hypothetical protein
VRERTKTCQAATSLSPAVVTAFSEWGTAQEPHAAAAPSTSEIASAIARLFFTFHSVMRRVLSRHDEGSRCLQQEGAPSTRYLSR